MKLAHRLLLPAMALFAINAYGQTEELPSATINGMTYTVTSMEEHTCELTKSTDESHNFGPDLVIPATVEIEGENYSVTSINSSWMTDYDRFFKTISIPATLTEIHNGFTFSTLLALTDIFVAEDNPALASVDGVLFNADKTSLTRMPCDYFSTRPGLDNSYEVPATVKTLEYQAFRACKGLKHISIPASTTFIDTNCFGQSGLVEIDIPDNVTQLSEFAFQWYGIFGGCTDLRRVRIGNGITTLPEYMFFNCEALESVSIGDKATSVPPYLFDYCFALKEVVLGKSITSVASMQNSVISNTIKCRPTVPPTCEASENFNATTYSQATLVVPPGCKEAYAAAKGWSGFAKITESEELSGIDAATDGTAPAADVRYENGVLTCDAWNNGTHVTVYATNGATVLSAIANDGKVAFPAVAGFYIVAANGSTSKLLVR